MRSVRLNCCFPPAGGTRGLAGSLRSSRGTAQRARPRSRRTKYIPDHRSRVLRQLITEACSAAEFGSGVMVRAPWAALEKRLKELVSRALRVASIFHICILFVSVSRDPSGVSRLRSCWESWVSCRSMRVRPCIRCRSGMPCIPAPPSAFAADAAAAGAAGAAGAAALTAAGRAAAAAAATVDACRRCRRRCRRE